MHLHQCKKSPISKLNLLQKLATTDMFLVSLNLRSFRRQKQQKSEESSVFFRSSSYEGWF